MIANSRGSLLHRRKITAVAAGLLLIVGLGSCTDQGAKSEKFLKCETRKVGETSLLYCRPDNSGFESKDLAALGLSLLAFVISVSSLIYGINKDKRARKQSIDDDFWIRTQLGTSVIEPLNEQILKIANELPADCGTTGYSKDKLVEFARSSQQILAQQQNSMLLFKIVDAELKAAISTELNEIEDLVLNYSAANASNQKSVTGRPLLSKRDTSMRLVGKVLDIWSKVRRFQLQGL